jgi:hypothetical protein
MLGPIARQFAPYVEHDFIAVGLDPMALPHVNPEVFQFSHDRGSNEKTRVKVPCLYASPFKSELFFQRAWRNALVLSWRGFLNRGS